MGNLIQLLLSGLFLGFAFYVGRNIGVLHTGDDSHKGPPEIKSVKWVYMNGSNWLYEKRDN